MSFKGFCQIPDSSLPESNTETNLTEPLLEVIKEEPQLDIPDTEQLYEVFLVVKQPKPEPASPIPEVALFCSLCLRPCASDQVVEFSTEPSWNGRDVANGRDKLAPLLGVELELEQCSICRACWTLVEMLADFREGCLKAFAWRARFSYGLDEVGDDWLSKENLEVMEKARKVVQKHAERMEMAEIEARNRQDLGTDEVLEEKPMLKDEKDWVEDASYPDSPRELPKNDSPSESAEIVEKMEISAFSCAKCQRKFETKSGMAIHFKYCINPTRKKPLVPKLHTCSICSANFRYWSQLEEHFTRHAGSKEFECRKGNCKRRFFSMPSRKKHENNCKGMNLLEVNFGQESSATCSKTIEMQVPTEIRVHPCKNCPRKFDTEGGLSKHAWRCKEPDQNRQLHTCEVCSMEFLNAKNLDAHMNKHNGIKPYRCKNESCGMHFYGKLEMYAHGRVCGKDKPICQLCGRQLSSEVTLRAHMETHAEEPTAECETCGKKFKTKKLLKTHQAVHSDERKFSCDECGKAYKTLYALKVHRRNHMEVKPFSCTVCGKGFVYKCLVKPHMDKHHGGGD